MGLEHTLILELSIKDVNPSQNIFKNGIKHLHDNQVKEVFYVHFYMCTYNPINIVLNT